ncbi:hypothetical protein J3Q64DRAFT_1731471 [Phycomyces blakesleeanus]
MPVFRLPFEIITNISGQLNTKDKYQCALVCRAWRTPFTESLWRKVKIHSEIQLEAFCSSLSTITPAQKSPARLVKQLALRPYIGASNAQLHLLQQHLTFIDRLWVDDESLIRTCSIKNMHWGLWKCLTKLDFHVPSTDFSTKEVLEILSYLPNLTQLSLGERYLFTSSSFSIQDMETTHSYLPRLEKLSINTELRQISTQDMDWIKNVVPAKALTFLEFDSTYATSEWLYYCAHKYPNISLMKWSAGDQDIERPTFEDTVSKKISVLRNAFQRLEKVTIECDSEQVRLHQVFLKILLSQNALLKDFTYSMDTTYSKVYYTAEFIKKLMRCFGMSLETLTLDITANLNDQLVISRSFLPCPRLVELKLRLLSLELELDIILDLCPVLKKLDVAVNVLSISPDSSEQLQPHDLRFLRISGAKASATLFNYVSWRCRDLQTLDLCGLRVSEQISALTGNFRIYMPYSHFEVLKLENIHFYRSSSYRTCSERNRVRLVSFAQESPHQNSTGLEVNRNWLMNDPPKGKADWFYQCFAANKFSPLYTWQKLVGEEIEYTKNYFRTFVHDPLCESHVVESPMCKGCAIWKHHSNRDKWKHDLPLGYVNLRCGSAKAFIFKSGSSLKK